MDRNSFSVTELEPAIGEAEPLSLEAMTVCDERQVRAEEPSSLYRIRRPLAQLLPIVTASPHSGAVYPEDFVAASRLDALALRKSEDSFIDEIFADAPDLGSPLIAALFPRAFVDPNREPYELDPTMFEDELPAFVNSRSPRVAVGLGTIARIVGSGEDIYAGKLQFAEAERRIEGFYRPYHAALAQLLQATFDAFSCYVLLDCHSMPSGSTGHGRDRSRRVDIVLGDCHGTTCHPVLVDVAEQTLKMRGYAVARNTPYAGGFVTASYGKPWTGRHGLQIELNRALYMDEKTMERKPFLAQLRRDMAELVRELGRVECQMLLAD